MGRWGYRLFEGDQDLDLAADLGCTFGSGDDELHFSQTVYQNDIVASPEAKEFYKTAEYATELDAVVASIRQRLDTDNLGDRLFAMYRAKENEYGGKYRVIVVGAVMMRVGAKIRDADLQHLRDLVPQINCNEGRAPPLNDYGFRGPGKRQFLAALDAYQPGTPRSFAEPSCFACGKTEPDIGKALLKCSRCQMAFYCDKACQRAHWQGHKPTCSDPARLRMLNV
ncbi:MYND finger domain-containing protein [Coniochaeta hoffmannii]|uniref:MYND finger domain-containing protein n=1 Tax=Coniochaeta hoffmannii TaxID=91930 RepID=A0AA38R222_9PEZI|nr:MYND finger domain-containing protein [Coniochaeta hoffmannii]